mmetsp:Transcript_15791/g.37365  ORF Transcript_15791/g.37365 Transcript_15791/m.37365 type:complete len:429 (+) Transcript_15791:79-1365(+)
MAATSEEDDFLDSDSDLMYDDDPNDDADSFGGEEYLDEIGASSQNITAEDVAKGRDIQGIPWETLLTTRDRYRLRRLVQYRNYENLQAPHDEINRELDDFPVRYDGKFYRFQHNTRDIRSSIVHFQLRNLVWANSAHDVYVMHDARVYHWSSLTRKRTEIAQLQSSNFGGQLSISTMAVQGNVCMAGGFYGDIVVLKVNTGEVVHAERITTDQNAITNAIVLCDSPSGSLQAVISNNDCNLRYLDLSTFVLTNCHTFPWAINYTALSPDGKLACVVGDCTEVVLADADSGQRVATLSGHIDYSFACAWHPGGNLFATGNQDKTCRIWDRRYPKNSVAVLGGRIGAIRSIRFTGDGRYMAIAEPADFVHVYDCDQMFQRRQELDMFGEIAGIGFSPDAESLFLGVHDRTYGGLLEFQRCHPSVYNDVLM